MLVQYIHMTRANCNMLDKQNRIRLQSSRLPWYAPGPTPLLRWPSSVPPRSSSTPLRSVTWNACNGRKSITPQGATGRAHKSRDGASKTKKHQGEKAVASNVKSTICFSTQNVLGVESYACSAAEYQHCTPD